MSGVINQDEGKKKDIISTNPSGYAAGLTSGGPCALTNSDEPLPPPPKKSYCYSYMAKQNSSKKIRAGAMAKHIPALKAIFCLAVRGE